MSPDDSARRNSRPAHPVPVDFPWWPWQTLALLLPPLAYGAMCCVLAFDPAPPSEQRAILSLLTLWGAGNAILVGIAIGDLGRTLLAMTACSAVALLVRPLGSLSGLLLIPLLQVLVICGCLALEWSPRGIWAAVLTGLIAFLLAAATALGLVVLLLISFSFAARAPLNTSNLQTGLELALALIAAAANHVLLRRILRTAKRVARVTEGADSSLEQRPQQGA